MLVWALQCGSDIVATNAIASATRVWGAAVRKKNAGCSDNNACVTARIAREHMSLNQ